MIIIRFLALFVVIGKACLLFLGLMIYLEVFKKFFDQTQRVDFILSILHVVMLLEGTWNLLKGLK